MPVLDTSWSVLLHPQLVSGFVIIVYDLAHSNMGSNAMLQKPLYAFLLLALLLSSCYPNISPEDPKNDNSSKGPVVISFGAQEHQRSLYEPLIRKFNAENLDVRVQFVTLPPQNGSVDDIMRGIVSAADTAIVNGIRTVDMANGNLYDLSSLMMADASFDQSDFYPGLLEMFSKNERIYLLPRAVNPAFVLYNKDVWRKSGLGDPKLDWTWNELLSSAEQIAQSERDIYGFVDGKQGFSVLLAVLNEFGITPFSQPAQQVYFERPEFAQAVSRVISLSQARALYVSKEPTIQDIDNLILNQKVGIWNPTTTTIKPSSLPFEVGVLPLPNAPLPANDFIYVDGYIMSGGTQHPTEAWRWLSFLSRQVFEVRVGEIPSSLLIPSRRSVVEQSETWKNLDVAVRETALAALTNIAAFVSIGNHDDNVYGALAITLNDVLQGTISADQASSVAQENLEQRMAAVQNATPAASSAIIVATPMPIPDSSNVTTVRFVAPHFEQYLLRQSIDNFNRANTDMFVQLVDNSSIPNEYSISNLAQTSDCFTWDKAPTANDILLLKDLQPYLDSLEIEASEYPKNLLAYFQYEGHQYAIPHSFMLPVVNYNKVIFDNLYIEAQNPNWTPDEFLLIVTKITNELRGQKQYGFIDIRRSITLNIVLSQFDAQLLEQSNQELVADFTDPNVIKAIDYYMKLVQISPYVNTNEAAQASSPQIVDPIQAFVDGRIGSLFSYQLFNHPQGSRFLSAVAPLPKDSTLNHMDSLQSIGLFVSTQAEHPNACLRWFEYFSENISLLSGWFPARIPVAESEEFRDQAPFGTTHVYTEYLKELDSNDTFRYDNSAFLWDVTGSYWLLQAIDRSLQGSDLKSELEMAQTVTQNYLRCVTKGQEKLSCAQQADPEFKPR